MANIVPHSFKGELLSGTHNFANGGDTFKIALYTSNPYTVSSPTAVTTHEVSSAGSSNYARKDLASQAVAASTATASVDFADVTWGAATTGAATFSAAFAAIFNSSDSDKLCVVLDFGGTKTATNGDFTISFPDPSTPSNAIISLTSS